MKRRTLTKKRRKDAGNVKATREGWKRTWHYQSFRRLPITPANPVATCVRAPLKGALLIRKELYIAKLLLIGII